MPKPLNYEQITNLSAVVGLQEIPTGDQAYSALIQAEAQDVRWTDDGTTTPTAGIGMILPAKVSMEYDGDLRKLKFIEAVAGGKLNISYYGV